MSQTQGTGEVKSLQLTRGQQPDPSILSPALQGIIHLWGGHGKIKITH